MAGQAIKQCSSPLISNKPYLPIIRQDRSSRTLHSKVEEICLKHNKYPQS